MDCSSIFASWVSSEAQARAAQQMSEPYAPQALTARRAFYDAFNRRCLDVARELHRVEVSAQTLAGVPVQVVTAASGSRASQTLICLHGGAFMWGSGAGALLEAVPVAAITGMRVIAV